MSRLLKIIFFVFSAVLLFYVSLPSPEFPSPPTNVSRSYEPGDMESSLRRGYYTNLNRAEIMAFYGDKFNQMKWIPQLRLNYPPEEAQTLIRDQTKSTYLEELVHPLRESIFINGFESEGTSYELNHQGRIWKSKVTVKYIPSSVYVRVLVSILALFSIYLLVKEYKYVKKTT